MYCSLVAKSSVWEEMDGGDNYIVKCNGRGQIWRRVIAASVPGKKYLLRIWACQLSSLWFPREWEIGCQDY